MSNFPSTIAILTNPLANQQLNAPSHSGIETAQNGEIVQIENVIGTASSIIGTIIGDLRNPNSSGGGHIQQANTGGTGQTSYSKGNILVASSASVLTKVNVGADNTVLTADSTQTAGVSWKTNAGLTAIQNTFTANTSVTSGQAVYVGAFSSDGGVMFDRNSAIDQSAASSITTAFSIGNNPNREMVVFVGMYAASGSPSIVSATVNNSVMAIIDQGAGGTTFGVASLGISNPPSGSVTLAITASESCHFTGVYYSYYNAKQSGQPDSHSIQSPVAGTAMSSSVLTVNNGSLVISAFMNLAGSSQTMSNFSGIPNNSILNGTANDGTRFFRISSGDNGQTFPPQSVVSAATSGSATYITTLQVGLIPAIVPDFQIAAASASNVTTSAPFIGFVPGGSSIASGQSGLINITGLATGLSSLMAGGQYYLSNTPGAISTTPGAITRKVGIAVSSIALSITNNW